MQTETFPTFYIGETGSVVIAGTTTKVIEVVGVQAHGYTPQEVQEQLPHLTLAQISGALSYYNNHKAELDADIAARQRYIADLRARHGNPFTRAELEARLKEMNRKDAA